MTTIDVVGEADRPETEGTPGAFRRAVYDVDETMLVQSRIAAGTTTGWHTNGDRRVFGYVTAGRATLEHGPGGEAVAETRVGDFLHVPPGTVRRVVNDGDEDWVVVICFVGTGPPFENLDGPEPA